MPSQKKLRTNHLSMRHQNRFKIGIDLGGTKIECAVLDTDSKIIFREREKTPQGDYQGTLQTIKQLVERAKIALNNHSELCEGQIQNIPVGVGIPGTLSSDNGRVKNANSTCLIGEALDKDLEALLNCSVTLANDANCFVWSEYCDGAAKDHQSAFGVIIGTGVGGGIAINNGLVAGRNGIAGEWGHNPLPFFPLEDRACYCGKKDCIETYLSGPAFSNRFNEKLSKNTGKKTHYSSQQIIELAHQNDSLARAHFDEYCKMLAASLTTIINTLDPDVIVLGGGMSNLPELAQRVESLLPEFVFSDQLHTRVVKAEHGDSSGVRGAAWLN